MTEPEPRAPLSPRIYVVVLVAALAIIVMLGVLTATYNVPL